MRNTTLQCYLCGGHMRFFIHKHGYDIVLCPMCKLIATDFRKPYRRFIDTFYGKQYFTGGDECGAYENYEEDKQFILRNTRIVLGALDGAKRGKLLDVGCAMGYLVDEAVSRGWDAYGIDPSTYAISRVSKTLKQRVKTATIDEISYPRKSFQCVTMLDVVEHLKDPRRDLDKIRSILTDDGELAITTGDCESWLARLLGRHWTFYNPPQHLFFYSKSSLTRLLHEAGFTPVRWFGMGKWVRLGYVLHLAATTMDFPWMLKVEEAVRRMGFVHIPLYLPLGDNMVVVAKKEI